jgi:CheY-like chemotaxis protein
MTTPWILCVDDEQRVLDAFERNFGLRYDLTTVNNGAAAMSALRQKPNCAVVLSDMRMPGMTGLQVLTQARELAPDATRIMLTGESDRSVAIDAVNEGRIFRFLSKPCPTPVIQEALNEGLEMWRLRNSEKELLEQTLIGAATALVDILAAASPMAFSRAGQVRDAVMHAAQKLDLKAGWELPLAALLARIGWAVLPAELVERYLTGDTLSAEEERRLADVPAMSAKLLGPIPRLEGVADLIRSSGTGGSRRGPGAVIAAAEDLVVLLGRGVSMTMAIGDLETQHDRSILAGFQGFSRPGDAAVTRTIKAAQIETGMTVMEDVRTAKGSVLVRANTQLSAALAEQVRSFATTVGIIEPIKVRASR